MTIEYLAVYGLMDKPDSPSSIVRRVRSKNPPLYETSICNSRMPWRESNDLIKYFIGISDNGYSITAEDAERFIKPWRKNWPQPKDQVREEDL
jgi:hypothetical protein